MSTDTTTTTTSDDGDGDGDGAAREEIYQALDIFLSHDWPTHITRYGAEAALLRKKPFFKDEVRSGTLGSMW